LLEPSLKGLLDMLSRSIDGDTVFKIVSDIWGSDRFFDFKSFGETASYCAERLRKAGLEVEVFEVPADGRTRFGDWVMPKAWDVEDAYLALIEPREHAQVLARYREVPQSLFMYSAPTPEDGVVAEVVYVRDADKPESYEGVDIRGKILLTEKPGSSVERYAASKGAIGIISYKLGGHGVKAPPDVTAWENACFLPDNPKGLFGFSLPPERGEWLKNLVLEAASRGEKVRVKAVVKTRLYDGVFKVVSALIPGSTDEEVWAIGHLYEVGANDNASGCGVMMAVAEAIRRLIDEGRLPKPKRGLRFIFTFECYGTMAYLLAHEKLASKALAGINLDMVGGDQNKCLSVLELCENPHVALSFTDALARRLMIEAFGDQAYPVRWRPSSFMLDDNLIADPCFGIPTPSIIGVPDRFWHTSGDTPEILDKNLLAKIGVMSAAYMLLIAYASDEDALWLLDETLSFLESKVLRDVDRFRTSVYNVVAKRNASEELATILEEAEDKLRYWKEIGHHALKSVLKLSDGGLSQVLENAVEEAEARLNAKVEEELENLRRLAERLSKARGVKIVKTEKKLSADEEYAASIVPKRLVIGTLTFKGLPEELRRLSRWEPAYSTELNTPLFWIDGRRSLLEIYRLVRCETGRFDLRELIEYFSFLEKAGYVKLEKKRA